MNGNLSRTDAHRPRPSKATRKPQTPPVQEGVSANQTAIVALGQGYDTFESSGRSTIITGTTASAGTRTESYYQICESIESLSEALNISASVAASYGVGSADAKSSFMGKLDVTTTSVSIVVYTNVMTAHDVLTHYELASRTEADSEKFFQYYGDSFVSEIAKGSEYMAVYVFNCQSVEEQKSLTASLTGKYKLSMSGSLSAGFQASMQEITESEEMEQRMEQLITGFSQPPSLPSEDQIVNFALNFTTLTPDAPITISWATTGYEAVPGAPDFTTIAKNVALYVGDETLPGLSGNYATLSGVQNQIQSIQSIYAQYGGFNDQELTTKAAQVTQDLDTLNQLIHDMNANPTISYQLPELPSLAYGSPALTYTVMPGDTWGGNGGEPFQDVDYTSVPVQTVLSKLQMRGGSYVDALYSTYKTYSSEVVAMHGGSGGSLSNAMNLGDNEFVTKIVCKYGSYVNQLTFYTSAGNVLKWPANPAGAPNTAEYPVPAGSVLLGFQGRSGRYLDQLQPVLLAFQPATWKQT